MNNPIVMTVAIYSHLEAPCIIVLVDVDDEPLATLCMN